MKYIKQNILFFAITLTTIQTFAGGDNRAAGARSAALGNASVAVADLWSAFNNQAGLARLENAEFGFYYENRYLLKELGYSALAMIYPMKSGTIALSATYFGYSAYNEGKIGFAYAKAFGKYISFGLQLDYNMARLAESYGNRNFMTFEAGLLANITPRLAIGVHVYNPVSAKLSQFNDERAPVIFRIGAAFEITGKILLTAETEKSINSDASVKAGIEYKLIPQLYLRGGISTNPTSNAFGVGLFFGDFIIDISTSYHQVLGFSPQVSLSYKL